MVKTARLRLPDHRRRGEPAETKGVQAVKTIIEQIEHNVPQALGAAVRVEIGLGEHALTWLDESAEKLNKRLQKLARCVIRKAGL